MVWLIGLEVADIFTNLNYTHNILPIFPKRVGSAVHRLPLDFEATSPIDIPTPHS